MKKLSLILVLLLVGGAVFASDNSKVGVLVLAHGGNQLWDETVTKAVAPLKADYEVEIAFGMANPKSMQEGINKLEDKGVNTIVVIQLFVSSYSMIIRQNEYLLGFRKELADPPMLMMHHGHGSASHSSPHGTASAGAHAHHNMGANSDPVELNPLEINAKILLTEPLNDNPVLVSIILDRVQQLSTTPKNETVILVAHGPNDKDDNIKWLAELHKISNQIKSAYGVNSFRDVTYLTLRDDAPEEVYNAAKQHFRSVVETANKNGGQAIIVPVLLSKGGIEKRLKQRLDGLDYVWDGNTILPDERITKFMRISIENALADQQEVLD